MKRERQNRRCYRSDVRVAHLTTVHHALDPRIFHKQLKTLREAGYDAHLVAPHQQSRTVDGIAIHALPRVDGRYRRVMLQRQAYQLAINLSADCYHIHDPELIPLAYVLKRETGASIVYDMHEDYRWHGPVEGRVIRGVERWCFRWVDHVILAESSYRSIVEEGSVEATFVGNYMRPRNNASPSPPPRNKPGDPFRLLYTGVVGASRGLFHMIDVVDSFRVAGRDAVLNVVGICNFKSQRQRAEASIDQRNLHHCIQRVGWDSYVPAADMVSYYQAADVGLALFDPEPNYVHSTPTKFFEYLHFGLPILCSDFPRWRQFIEQHKCGAVVPPGDTEAACAVLRQWRTDPRRYQQLSTAARKAASQYQWDTMGSRLVRLYDELLGVQEPTG